MKLDILPRYGGLVMADRGSWAEICEKMIWFALIATESGRATHPVDGSLGVSPVKSDMFPFQGSQINQVFHSRTVRATNQPPAGKVPRPGSAIVLVSIALLARAITNKEKKKQ